MHDALTDAAGFFPDEFPGLLVEGDETGSGGCRNVDVRPIHPVRGGGENLVSGEHDGARSDVVGEDAELGADVITPDDVGTFFTLFDRLGALEFLEPANPVFLFLLERAVVAVAHPVGVETDDLAAVGHDIAEFAIEENGGTNPEVFPVGHLAGLELGHAELPVESAGLLIERHDDPVVALHRLDAGLFVVRSHKDLTLVDRRGSVGL